MFDSVAFMFCVEASGIGTIQIVGPGVVRFQELSGGISGFRASLNQLRMRHWDVDGYGYEVSSNGCGDRLPGGINWKVKFKSLLSCGDRNVPSRCTATKLSHLRLFEPGWQVLIAHGVVFMGEINFGSSAIPVRGGAVYVEKIGGLHFIQDGGGYKRMLSQLLLI